MASRSISETRGAIHYDPFELAKVLRAESAKLALDEAKRSCHDPVGGEHSMCGDDCGWFHGAWQYLLLLGMSASPERNLPFYREELYRAVEGNGRRHILIAGCSDHTMLSIVLAACADLSVMPRITVVDRCETPLVMCRWFAEQVGCDVATQKTDLVSYDPDAPFDVICTDGLLSNLEPAGRADIAAALHRLLDPGDGVLVTTNNIRPGRQRRLWRSAETLAGLCETAVERRAALPIEIELSDAALRDLARDFFSHPKSRSVSSVAEFESYFPAERFRIDRLDYVESSGHALRDATNSGEFRKTLNARLVARRRDG